MEDGSLDTGLYTWHNDISAPELLGIQNELSTAIAKEEDKLDKELKEVVAHSTVDLMLNDPEAKTGDGHPVRIIRLKETNLGDLCADACRDQAGSDVAIVNGGGIRAELKKGDITRPDILSLHPFGNMLSVIEVTGKQLLDALEWGARSLPHIILCSVITEMALPCSKAARWYRILLR